jgi:hypothetical protein
MHRFTGICCGMQHVGLILSKLPGDKPLNLALMAPNLVDIVQK